MNVIAVYNRSMQKILMCKRRKPPFKDLYNLVGGKAGADEDGVSAAYRELQEETAITREDIELVHLMDFNYILAAFQLEVYFGILNKEIRVHGEENDLVWMDANEDFFDRTRFAGEGNIGHMIRQIKLYVCQI